LSSTLLFPTMIPASQLPTVDSRFISHNPFSGSVSSSLARRRGLSFSVFCPESSAAPY
jgi:hypothetical protein